MKSCVSLFYFVSLIQLVPVPVECVRRLINIDYLGIGYDAIQGNPQSQLEDPGFRQSIFPLEYTKSTVTADGRYMIPDNTEAYQITSCGYQTSSEEVRDEHTYRQSLSVCRTTFLRCYFPSTSSLVTNYTWRDRSRSCAVRKGAELGIAKSAEPGSNFGCSFTINYKSYYLLLHYLIIIICY